MAAIASADDLLRAVGRRIGEIRQAAGMTQEEAAERLGIAIRVYRRLESGRENLTLRTMFKITTALGVTVADLLVPPQSTAARRGRPRTQEIEPARTRARPKNARS